LSKAPLGSKCDAGGQSFDMFHWGTVGISSQIIVWGAIYRNTQRQQIVLATSNPAPPSFTLTWCGCGRLAIPEDLL